ncbi:MAG: adenylyltransferase/cytidyltransferase family protein, partial [Pseudomonadota bacterium]
MTTADFDFLVFVGRFQPPHIGHQAIVREALARSQHLVLLVGSAHRPRCLRNPWTFAERETMLRGLLTDDENRRVFVLPVMDATYNDDLWITTIQKCVAGVVAAHHRHAQREPRIGLIGHAKDRSSYYLRLFPQWASVDVPSAGEISSTDLRDAIFRSDAGSWEDKRVSVDANVGELVPPTVLDALREFVR